MFALSENHHLIKRLIYVSVFVTLCRSLREQNRGNTGSRSIGTDCCGDQILPWKTSFAGPQRKILVKLSPL